MTRPPAPVLVVEVFPEVRHRLVALLTELADTQWAAPTVCPGWSVKDVALHLLGVTVANISRRRDGLVMPLLRSFRGLPIPPTQPPWSGRSRTGTKLGLSPLGVSVLVSSARCSP